MNNERILYFFTSNYPYGKSETFIENEIEILCNHFNRVFIFPSQFSDDFSRPIPDNAEVIKIPSTVSESSFFDKIKFNYGLAIFSLKELIRNPISSNKFRYRLAYFKQIYSRCLSLVKVLKGKDMDNIVFYTYWFEDWSTVLSELKRKKVIPSYVSRVHGFDLFEERSVDGFIPFRSFQLKYVDQLFFISRNGLEYMQSKYPEYSLKYKLSYLGIKDHGELIAMPSNQFQLLSISNLIPLKRVHLIIEILKRISVDVKWTHFGDGELMCDLKEMASDLPSNISIVFKGRVANAEMLDEIKNNYFDLFINVSETEGLPVSIMEAISFGIPIIATNVGGISEIVNQQTGILLESDFKPEEAARKMERFLEEKARDYAFRSGVRKFWNENYSAQSNYKEFIDLLESTG